RTLGGAFGTAIFGTILSHDVSNNLKTGFAELAKTNPDALAQVDPTLISSLTNNTEAIATLPAVVQNTVLDSFMSAFHSVFIAATPVVALGFFFAIFLKEKPLQDSNAHASARQDAAGEALG
ncbi:MAG: MFS transporter, partial [Actinobacteria bacterium]|nr:MFS transporter [Actinomycetota bacterium]